MPPKPKYTREEILDVAYKILEKDGIEAVVSRGIGKKLGMSSSPVFTFFENMDELHEELKDKGWKQYSQYIKKAKGYTPSYRRKLIETVRFAKDHPNIFDYIFVNGTGKYTEILNAYFFFFADDIVELKKKYDVSDNCGRAIYDKLWIFVFGIAVLSQKKIKNYTETEIENLIYDVEYGLVLKHKKISITEQEVLPKIESDEGVDE